jgi:hypothetical protein
MISPIYNKLVQMQQIWVVLLFVVTTMSSSLGQISVRSSPVTPAESTGQTNISDTTRVPYFLISSWRVFGPVRWESRQSDRRPDSLLKALTTNLTASESKLITGETRSARNSKTRKRPLRCTSPGTTSARFTVLCESRLRLKRALPIACRLLRDS